MIQPTIHITNAIFYDPEHQKVGVQAFMTLMGKWGIDDSDACTLIGIDDIELYRSWKQKFIEPVSGEVMLRNSYFLGIHKCLRTLYANPMNLYGWITSPNERMGGMAPLGVMLADGLAGIHRIHEYLHMVAFIIPSADQIH